MGLALDANFFCVWKCKNYTATGQSFKNNFVEFMVHRMMIILFERILKMWESIKFSWFLFQYFFPFLFPNRWNLSGSRVPTRTGKPGKPGKMGRHFPVREKSGNFEQTGKVREKSGKITQNTGKLRKFEINITWYFWWYLNELCIIC